MKGFEAYWIKMPSAIAYYAATYGNQVKVHIANTLQDLGYAKYNPYIEIRVQRRPDLDVWASQFKPSWFQQTFGYDPKYVCCPISKPGFNSDEIYN